MGAAKVPSLGEMSFNVIVHLIPCLLMTNDFRFENFDFPFDGSDLGIDAPPLCYFFRLHKDRNGIGKEPHGGD